MDVSPVGVFWDFENAHPPKGLSGYDIVNKLRRFVEPFGPVTDFKAYFDVQLERSTPGLQQELQNSGVTLIHTPHNGKKEVVDKKMIVDIMLFALGTQASKTIVLITGDTDFSDALSKLRLRGHKICVVHPGTPPSMPSPSLVHVAHTIVNWRSDILEYAKCEALVSPAVKTTTNVKVSDTSSESGPEAHTKISNPVSSAVENGMGETILFKALIHVLETMGASSECVRQSLVQRELLKHDPKALKRLGVSSMNEYFNRAFKLGIIKRSLGNTKETQNKPFVSLIPQQLPCPPSRLCFGLLVDVIKGFGTQEGSSNKQSTVEAKLLDRDPSFFSQMNLSTPSYFLLAETAGVISFISVGKKKVRKNIILCPKYRS